MLQCRLKIYEHCLQTVYQMHEVFWFVVHFQVVLISDIFIILMAFPPCF